MDIQTIRKGGENFLKEWEREQYLFYSGQKDKLDFSSIYDRYGILISKESIQLIRRTIRDAKGDKKKRLRYLLEFFVITYNDSKIVRITDKIDTAFANAIITLPDGDKISYYNSQNRLSNESNRMLREHIEKEGEKVLSKLNPMLESTHSETLERANEIGFKDYISMIQSLSGINLYELNDLMQEFLRKTNNIYYDSLKECLGKNLGVDIKEAKFHDIIYLFRGRKYDCFFPNDKMIPSLKEFTQDMGIDITAGGNIKINTGVNDRKPIMACCSHMDIPGETFLVIPPYGGYKSYALLLHELGHALHRGYTDKDNPFEYRWLGDNSVSEGFAFTFEHLLHNPYWLSCVLSIQRDKEFLYFVYLKNLFYLRDFAGELAYELELYKTPELEGKDKLFSEIMGNAWKVECPETMYLRLCIPNFYIARYIRALLFESLLSAYLERNYGKEWFRCPVAGKFLMELWNTGQKYTVEELTQKLGFKELQIQPLIKRIDRYLRIKHNIEE